VRDPIYLAPRNLDHNGVTVTFTVRATCDDLTPDTAYGSTTLFIATEVFAAMDIALDSFPQSLAWDASGAVALTCRHHYEPDWDPADGYQLLNMDGVDRWSGPALLPLAAVVAPWEPFAFAFDVTAPPVTTVRYDPSTAPTGPAETVGLACVYAFAKEDDCLPGGVVSQPIVISRFPDIQPNTLGAWARFYVEECAGRVPMIVGGYGDGTYRPTLAVDRGAMAVFMARALKLSLPSYQGRFSDVSSTHWAVGYIEALAGANVVSGYEDGSYRPADLVNRGAMAVYVARGMAGGDSFVPPGPGTPSFPDVPLLHWAYKYVEYARTQGVVGGYPDGSYWPDLSVDRGQMAVYVYRGFIQPTGAAVVLAGPAVTAVNPATGGECGWASAASHYYGQSRYAYVAFDAMRLGPNLLYPQAPSGTLEVRFDLRAAATPTTPATDIYTHTESLSAERLLAARAAACASGYPHFSVTWQLPALLDLGDYLLVVSVRDETGRMQEVARRPALTFYQP
jgi:hypothetical protein